MTDETVRAAERAIAHGSQSFAAAARLFRPDMREGAVMLYAWCRHCDDVVDGQDGGHAAVRPAAGTPGERVADLERWSRDALAGRPPADPAFAGLARVVRDHAIPPALPLAHLDGFRMDAEGRRYRTLDDLTEYCYRVAGVVGLMMAHVMGVRDPATLDRACDLGLAFQLTNIARDVVPDAREGRVYLPLDWLAEAGVLPDAVAEPEHRAALASLARRLVEAAEPYYDSAGVGIGALPFRAAWAIATARGVYRAIGLEVVRRGSRAWDERVSTSRVEKLRHVAAGAITAVRGGGNVPRSAGLWRRPGR